MYTRYQVSFDHGLNLVYRLESHSVAQRWAQLIDQLAPSDLVHDHSALRGLGPQQIPQSILDLNQVIDRLNSWLPQPIVLRPDPADLARSLNSLHTHFPELERSQLLDHQRHDLSLYNDLIHLIQNSQRFCPYLLVRSLKPRLLPLDPSEYSLFTTACQFGSLLLHYPHVGRHLLELFLNKDSVCPPDQIQPQTHLATAHNLCFYAMPDCSHAFSEFYSSSDLAWPYRLDDLRLALGYIPLGTLIQGSMSQSQILVRLFSAGRVTAVAVY
jgi:hypothetical protein